MDHSLIQRIRRKGNSLRQWVDCTLPVALGFVRYQRKRCMVVGVARARTPSGEQITVELIQWRSPPSPTVPVYYTDFGMVVFGRRVLADYSAITPNIYETTRALRARLTRMPQATRLDRATVFGTPHPHTYGDWFRYGLLALCSSRPLVQPVVVPQRFLYEKSYVRRDLARLGADVLVPDANGVVIEHPVLLAPHAPLFSWLPGEVDPIREAFAVEPPEPRKGSMLYLSREGEVAGSIERKYPSRVVEQVVRALGGRVIRTVETTFDQYLALAEEAETVVADHGSAQYNLAWWKAKRVIELQSTHKNLDFITFAASAGVTEYTVIDTVGRSDEMLQMQVRAAIGSYALSTP